ncbi:alpha/beta hydrolase [Salinimicrobium sp. MT39]|uniref:Alpha/beta hydrolase n=1 Tax=Salinimicrobium profundisediminis TaxID=2994553 RepID=A0A9X3CWC1_9FLAO|nr:alpha/beta hydrolase [Salinimicrobium profundisediminis]MCX2838016.1 alpha/beta hydrolase [Salinimicrobium profundisediminis]
MRYFLSFCFLFIYCLCPAQERFLDNIFEVDPAITETYATKDGEALKLDIYTPKNDTARSRPLIVFMHGGGFSGGSRTHEDLVKFSQQASRKGYVAVQISYRLTRKGQSFGCDYEASGKIETFQKAAEDFMDAVQFLVTNADKYRIDPQQIIVGGSSAGAEAVLNAVYNPQLMLSEPNKYQDIDIDGVFSLAGAVVDARYLTSKNAVPGVFFHGTKDNLVPYATAPHHLCEPGAPGYLMLDGSKTIVQKLKELNTSYLLYSFEGGKHEHSGVPFNELDNVFDFFQRVFLNNEQLQMEVWR